MKRKNVYVLGLDEFNRAKLESIARSDSYAFQGLIDPAELFGTYDFPVAEMLARAERELLERQSGGEAVDALTGYLDFPVSTMAPILCQRFALPGPSLESVLKCEHKYWSRLVQQGLIPEHIPEFQVFDPFEDQVLGSMSLAFPFWIKPVKSTGSLLGFRIESAGDFEAAVARIRERIHLLAGPFSTILERAELPPAVRSVPPWACMAESIISGRQCTAEGYAFHGEIQVFGIVDSIRYENGISFFRYEYPSTLPDLVQDRMEGIAREAVAGIGLDQAAFNIEFFWNREQDRIWLLEINPRVSQSHSDIFEKVDWQSNQQVAVQLACDERPEFPHRQGRFACAVKFFWRTFGGEALVHRAPSMEDVRRVEASFPGTVVMPQVTAGMRLSELLEQDSYSFAICHLFVGGKDTKDLLDTYLRCKEMLPFELQPL